MKAREQTLGQKERCGHREGREDMDTERDGRLGRCANSTELSTDTPLVCPTVIKVFLVVPSLQQHSHIPFSLPFTTIKIKRISATWQQY